MKERMQKTLSQVNGCPQRDRSETEWYGGVQTFMWMCEDNIVEVPFDKEYKAYEWGNTLKWYWHIANSPILATAISNNNLRAAGYITLMGRISNGTQNRNRRMRNRMYGGVRGR